MTIPPKEEKVKEELHLELREGQVVGGYNLTSFLLRY